EPRDADARRRGRPAHPRGPRRAALPRRWRIEGVRRLAHRGPRRLHAWGPVCAPRLAAPPEVGAGRPILEFHLPPVASYSRIVLSVLPDRARAPSGENATDLTTSACGMLDRTSVLGRSLASLVSTPASNASSTRPRTRLGR